MNLVNFETADSVKKWNQCSIH